MSFLKSDFKNLSLVFMFDVFFMNTNTNSISQNIATGI